VDGHKGEVVFYDTREWQEGLSLQSKSEILEGVFLIDDLSGNGFLQHI
jgi:hypothetical protein